MEKYFLFILLFPASSLPASAQAPIRDNSFLLEEAYNQETGVIQHINALQFDRSFRTADGSFTEEWPVGSELHQLSLTVPYRLTGENNLALNDLLINYRYQLVSMEKIFFSPRISFLLPTGNFPESETTGGTGFQLNAPLSIVVSTTVTLHANIGNSVTWYASKKNAATPERSESLSYGMSMIYSVTGNFNLMLETLHTSSFNKFSSAANELETTTLINPGFRFAINLPSGMQIVPGFSVPFDIQTEVNSYLIYLSIEHPLKRIKS